MQNKFIKISGLFMSCLILGLLLNVTIHEHNSSVLTTIHTDEFAPWG